METVLITGISKGIGLALAKKFLKEGFEVFGTVYTGAFSEKNEKLTIFNLDLSSPHSIADCAKEISATGKKINILINNAGALFDEEETSVVVDRLRKTLEVNLIGTIDFTEHLIPSLNSEAHIINISSTAGSLELTGHAESHYPYHYPCYKISKVALNMYTRTLALRFRNSKTIVSSVHPGWVKTDIGGQDANITTEIAAKNIYKLAISKPESGQFWFGDQKVNW